MSKWLMGLAAVAMVCAMAPPRAAEAADLPLSKRVAHALHARSGCVVESQCGCLRVAYDYHRELQSTYGIGFDPRNYDQTQPIFHLGPVRAYPRYWLDPAPGEAR